MLTEAVKHNSAHNSFYAMTPSYELSRVETKFRLPIDGFAQSPSSSARKSRSKRGAHHVRRSPA
jgi:hypothetical protein